MRQRRQLVSVLLFLLPVVGSANFVTEAHSRAFGPQKLVRVARPTLRWEVWPGSGSRVTHSHLSLNGRAVHPTYDEVGRTLQYTPQKPLAPGIYRVSAKVVVDNRLPVERKWEFRVMEGALLRVPDPTMEQERIVDEINRIRERLGLPPFDLDPRLCAASLAHSKYLNRNNLTGHYQRPSDLLFLGQSPSDRLDAYGYAQGSWEGVDFGAKDALQSIRRLFDAPYHRLPFLQPGRTSVGAGFVSKHMTVEFGMSETSGVSTSPADGERNVPLAWRSFEKPDPLRLHGAKGEVGYPIVFNFFSPKGEKIVVQGASLETAWGENVPIYLNTPTNDDHMESGAILIPKVPLSPNTGYAVKVRARTKTGDDLSRTWRFVTGAD